MNWGFTENGSGALGPHTNTYFINDVHAEKQNRSFFPLFFLFPAAVMASQKKKKKITHTQHITTHVENKAEANITEGKLEVQILAFTR